MIPPPAVILFRLQVFAPLEPAMIVSYLIANEMRLLGRFTTIEANEMRQRPFPLTAT